MYATDFLNTTQGVAKLPPLLASVTLNFIPLSAAPTAVGFGGMVFDGSGNLWVSDFHAVGTNHPGVYEFQASTFTLVTSITNSLFDNPLGLAFNPTDKNIYVANYSGNSVLEINTSSSNTVTTYASGGLSLPKYLGFIQNCTTPNGYIEVCKLLSTINPAPAGIYSFTVEGNANPVLVPSGECSGPISATAPAAKVTELLTPGIAATVTAIGYSPPTYTEEIFWNRSARQEPLLYTWCLATHRPKPS